MTHAFRQVRNRAFRNKISPYPDQELSTDVSLPATKDSGDTADSESYPKTSVQNLERGTTSVMQRFPCTFDKNLVLLGAQTLTNISGVLLSILYINTTVSVFSSFSSYKQPNLTFKSLTISPAVVYGSDGW